MRMTIGAFLLLVVLDFTSFFSVSILILILGWGLWCLDGSKEFEVEEKSLREKQIWQGLLEDWNLQYKSIVKEISS